MITIIQTTSSDKQELEKFLDHLVKSNKIACGHITAAISSIYNWENEVKHSDEYTAQLKTSVARCEEVVQYINAHHSYDLAEIIWWDINTTPEYQKWVEEETA